MIKSINIIDLQNKLAKNLTSILNQEIETTKKLLSNFLDKESTQRASILRLRNSLVYETVNYLNSELEIDEITLEKEDDYEQYLQDIHSKKRRLSEESCDNCMSRNPENSYRAKCQVSPVDEKDWCPGWIPVDSNIYQKHSHKEDQLTIDEITFEKEDKEWDKLEKAWKLEELLRKEKKDRILAELRLEAVSKNLGHLVDIINKFGSGDLQSDGDLDDKRRFYANTVG